MVSAVLLCNEPGKPTGTGTGTGQEQTIHTRKETQVLNHHVERNLFPPRELKGTQTLINVIPFKLTNILKHEVI